jgi:hypothetical protein
MSWRFGLAIGSKGAVACIWPEVNFARIKPDKNPQ